MADQIPIHTRERTTADGIDIRWQLGLLTIDSLGARPEGVIRAAIYRLQDCQEEVFCHENRLAIEYLNMALSCLHARSRDRHNRAVIGTMDP